MNELEIDNLPLPPTGYWWRLQQTVVRRETFHPDRMSTFEEIVIPNSWDISMMPEIGYDEFDTIAVTNLDDSIIIFSLKELLKKYESHNRKKLLEEGPVSLHRIP